MFNESSSQCKGHLNIRKHFEKVTMGKFGVAEMGVTTLAGNYNPGNSKVDWTFDTLISQKTTFHVDIMKFCITCDKTATVISNTNVYNEYLYV